MIYNITKKSIISYKPFYAVDFMSRFRGMIARNFQDFDSLVLERCSSVHTMFMSIKIDIIFIDWENRICKLRRNVSPWKPIVYSSVARAVIELPADNIARTYSETGDHIDLSAEPCEEEKKRKKKILGAPENIVPTIKIDD